MLLRNLRWLVMLLLGVLVGCAPVREWNPLDYSVKPGDTLYSIAWRYEVDFRDIARWNNIDPPYAIYPGQRLQLSADDGSGSFGHEAVVSDQAAAVTESEDAEVETEAATTEVIAPEPDEASTLNRASTVTVQKGDTLFSIAQRNGIHHSELARHEGRQTPEATTSLLCEMFRQRKTSSVPLVNRLIHPAAGHRVCCWQAALRARRR